VTHAAEMARAPCCLQRPSHVQPRSMRGSVPSPVAGLHSDPPSGVSGLQPLPPGAARRGGPGPEGNLSWVIAPRSAGAALSRRLTPLRAQGAEPGPDRGLPRRRGPGRPAGTRHRPVSRSRRSCRGPRCSRSCLMPGIIRCPESTAIQAGNPDHRGRGEEPGVSACSAGPGFGFRVGVVNARTALSSSRSAFPLRGWSRGCGGCGRMPAGGSEFAAPAGDLR
jgi:hypothetical protein